MEALPELAKVKIGLLHVFLQHTSASLSINENADPDVPVESGLGLGQSGPRRQGQPGRTGRLRAADRQLSRPGAGRRGDRRPDGRYGLAAHLRPTGRGVCPPVKGG